MQLVILAGGKGTRLGLTDVPKPMAEVAGKPLLEWQIELARRYNIRDIFILSGYLSNVIVDYFGDGSKWGVNIKHIIEETPLGTAGGLRLIKDELKERFLVFYGDIVMDFDIDVFIDFDRQDVASYGTLLVHPNSHPYDSDLLDVDKDSYVTGLIPKTRPAGGVYNNLVNAAVYILSPKILGFIADDTLSDFGKDIFPALLAANKQLRAYRTAEYVMDMGTKERLEKATNAIASGHVARLNRQNKRSAVFLDRDGVINKDLDTDISYNNFELLPNAAKAIALINNSGYLCIVVTNQPFLAKGFLTFEELARIHKKMETLLGVERAYIDAIYYCPHHPERGFSGEVAELKIDCECRKPKAGMLFAAQRDYNIDLHNSWLIGDRDADIQAGRTAGCQCILVDNEKIDILNAVHYILEVAGDNNQNTV
ncbi:HAD-IIIA family hydrolase [Deferribacterales bacterium RsTz2092]|nr:hypothetical protein AGMMS49941_04970 [Deferribacterales bacterium]